MREKSFEAETETSKDAMDRNVQEGKRERW